MNYAQRFLSQIIFGKESYYMQGIKQYQLPTNKFDISNPDAVSVATTCVKVLAETMAGMPLEIYKQDKEEGKSKDKKHPLYPILHTTPNTYTTANSFFQTLEYHRNFTGNAFALINRNNGSGRVTGLEIIHPSRVKGYKVSEGQLYYKVGMGDGKEDVTINGSEILHFKMMSKDGIWGINPIEALKMNMGISYKGLGSMDNFYENNALSPKALKPTIGGAANATRSQEAMDKFNAEYSGVNNSGKWINLPPNTDIVDLSISFADAQIIESLKFNAQQIAALYGVPVFMATGDYTQSKYNNIEQTGLSFKVFTMTPITRMYRAELEAKLFTRKDYNANKSIEFNMNSLIEPDTKTKTDYYRAMTNIGAMSPKTVAMLENQPMDDSQDILLAQTNLQSLDKFKTQVNED
jgi:HK97 family phage portal protein